MLAVTDMGLIAPPTSATRPTRVVILTASVGGGHIRPAAELAERLARRGARPDVIDLVALCPAGSGFALRSAFRTLLNCAPRAWDRIYRATDSAQHRQTPFRALMKLASGPTAAILAGRRDGTPADVVVSTYPFGGHLATAALRHEGLAVPVVTYVTDPGVHGLWVAPGTQRYLAGWPAAASALRRMGARNVVTVDPLVGPNFVRRAQSPAARTAGRARWGLPAGPLALVMSGSWGVGDMAGTATDLVSLPGVTPVVVCGRNNRLRRRLSHLRGAVVLGWIDDMASLMRACDVAVMNSGGSSLAEAQASGLPVVHYRALPGQGAANAAAACHCGASVWARNKDDLVVAVRSALRKGAAAPRWLPDAASEVLDAADAPADVTQKHPIRPPIRQRIAAAAGATRMVPR